MDFKKGEMASAAGAGEGGKKHERQGWRRSCFMAGAPTELAWSPGGVGIL